MLFMSSSSVLDNILLLSSEDKHLSYRLPADQGGRGWQYDLPQPHGG
jgi:hypothetical protein